MQLGFLKTLCRDYCNQIQTSNLTESVLVNAINDARAQWCNYVGFPRTSVTLVTTAGAAYALSTLELGDIEAVYLGTEAAENRLRPWEREDVDQAPTGSTLSTEDRTPIYYRYEELMAGTPAAWQKRFYLYDDLGPISLVAATNLIVIYTPSSVTPYTTTTANTVVLEIPDAYCYDLKYFVLFFHCQRNGQESTREREWSRWKNSTMYGDMMKNYAKRDARKNMRDTMAAAKQSYKDNF